MSKVIVERISDSTVDFCNTVTGKDKKKINYEALIRARHSPIRTVLFKIELFDVPYYVHTHLVRHNIGIVWNVFSQRPNKKRGAGPQDAPVNMIAILNAEAVLNISAKRLCHKADKETQRIWRSVIRELRNKDAILARNCVPECLVNDAGICPEMKQCKTPPNGVVHYTSLDQETEEYIKDLRKRNAVGYKEYGVSLTDAKDVKDSDVIEEIIDALIGITAYLGRDSVQDYITSSYLPVVFCSPIFTYSFLEEVIKNSRLDLAIGELAAPLIRLYYLHRDKEESLDKEPSYMIKKMRDRVDMGIAKYGCRIEEALSKEQLVKYIKDEVIDCLLYSKHMMNKKQL